MKMSSVLLASALLFSGCAEKNENVSLISVKNSTRSHNNGRVCMECHREGGKGRGVFTVAGSIYGYNQRDPMPRGIIRFYSEDFQKGELLLELTADNNGNFYTTEPVDFRKPMYAVAFSPDGGYNEMNIPLNSGACNSCHSRAPGRVWVP